MTPPKKQLTAFCWRSGLIETCTAATPPKGAMPIMRGAAKTVRDTIAATSRHARGGKAMFVPGVQKARHNLDALTAFHAYRAWLYEMHPRLVARCGAVMRPAISDHQANQPAWQRIEEAQINEIRAQARADNQRKKKSND